MANFSPKHTFTAEGDKSLLRLGHEFLSKPLWPENFRVASSSFVHGTSFEGDEAVNIFLDLVTAEFSVTNRLVLKTKWDSCA